MEGKNKDKGNVTHNHTCPNYKTIINKHIYRLYIIMLLCGHFSLKALSVAKEEEKGTEEPF